MKRMSKKERAVTQRREELLKRVRLAEQYKQTIITRYNETHTAFLQNTITEEAREAQLRAILGDKTLEEWVLYYDKYIQTCRTQLYDCDKQLRRYQKIHSLALFGPAVLIIALLLVTGIYYFANQDQIQFAPDEGVREETITLAIGESYRADATYSFSVDTISSLRELRLDGAVTVGTEGGTYAVSLVSSENPEERYLVYTGDYTEALVQFAPDGLPGAAASRATEVVQGETKEVEEPAAEVTDEEIVGGEQGVGEAPLEEESAAPEAEREEPPRIDLSTEDILEGVCAQTCVLEDLPPGEYTLEIEIMGDISLTLDRLTYTGPLPVGVEEERVPEEVGPPVQPPTGEVRSLGAVINQDVQEVLFVDIATLAADERITLPSGAVDVEVLVDGEVDELAATFASGAPSDASVLTGQATLNVRERPGFFTRLLRTIGITGNAISESEADAFITESNGRKEIAARALAESVQATKVAIVYILPGPEATQTPMAEGVELRVNSPVDYENVLMYATLETPVSEAEASRIRIEYAGGTITPTLLDVNNDGAVDFVSWEDDVSAGEEQVYYIIIEISDAYELDANRERLRDIYDLVATQDGVGVTIIDGHYVRVTFEEPLDNTKDISLVPLDSGDGIIEVYEVDGDELLATFTDLIDNQLNTIYLTELIGTQDTFDLRIVGADIELDYIVDPSPLSTSLECNVDGSATGSTCIGFNEEPGNATVDSCGDTGTIGTRINNMWINESRPFPGETIQVTCEVVCPIITQGYASVFYYNESDTQWTLIGEAIPSGTCSNSGWRNISFDVPITAGSTEQYVRCAVRQGASIGAATCSPAGDNDDMAITVSGDTITECGYTITQSDTTYYLGNDLNMTDYTSCITIATSGTLPNNVIIDGQGHSIYSETSKSLAISNLDGDANNFTLRNINISDSDIAHAFQRGNSFGGLRNGTLLRIEHSQIGSIFNDAGLPITSQQITVGGTVVIINSSVRNISIAGKNSNAANEISYGGIALIHNSSVDTVHAAGGPADSVGLSGGDGGNVFLYDSYVRRINVAGGIGQFPAGDGDGGHIFATGLVVNLTDADYYLDRGGSGQRGTLTVNYTDTFISPNSTVQDSYLRIIHDDVAEVVYHLASGVTDWKTIAENTTLDANSVGAHAFPSGNPLNGRANVTIFNAPGYAGAVLLRNGALCGSNCYAYTALDAQTVTFNVTNLGTGLNGYLYSIGDIVPPTFNWVYPPTGSIIYFEQSIFGPNGFLAQFTTADTDIDSASYSVDGGLTNHSIRQVGTSSTWRNLTYAPWGSDLYPGQKTIEVWVNDTSGNVNDTVSITIEIESNSTFACRTFDKSNWRYTLSQDIYSNGTCFTVTGDNLIIDGAGYSVIGNGSGRGFDILSAQNLTLLNVAVTNFTQGISLSLNSQESLFQHLYVFNNTEQGIVSAAGVSNTYNHIRIEGGFSGYLGALNEQHNRYNNLTIFGASAQGFRGSGTSLSLNNTVSNSSFYGSPLDLSFTSIQERNFTLENTYVEDYSLRLTGGLELVEYEYGSILFEEGFTSQRMGTNLSDEYFIGDNVLYLDTNSQLAMLATNYNWTLTINDFPTFTDPTILRDDFNCAPTVCFPISPSFATKPYEFKVNDWSNYSIGEAVPAITSCGVVLSEPNSAYTIANDLVIDDEDCITVLADNITIEGDGRIIYENIIGLNTHSGIYAENVDSLTVRNASIVHIRTGLNLSSVSNATFEDISYSFAFPSTFFTPYVLYATASPNITFDGVTASIGGVYVGEGSNDVVVRDYALFTNPNGLLFPEHAKMHVSDSTNFLLEDALLNRSRGDVFVIEGTSDDILLRNITVGGTNATYLDFNVSSTLFSNITLQNATFANYSVAGLGSVLTVESPFGRIEFTDAVYGAGAWFNNTVSILHNSSIVDTSLAPLFNQPALIDLYDISFIPEARILKDGLTCRNCENFTALFGPVVSFSVPSFSEYSIGVSTEPILQFTLPTPQNGTNVTDTSIPINYTVNDDEAYYTFTDFNGDLLFWMGFDRLNASDDPIDLSASSANGSVLGDPISNNGFFGNGFSFDGTDDYVDVPLSDFPQAGAPFTISVWFNTTSTSKLKYLFSIPVNATDGINYPSNARHYSVYAWSNRLAFCYPNALLAISCPQIGSFGATGGDTIHFTTVFDGQTFYFYRNGMPLSYTSTPPVTIFPIEQGFMRIGAQSTSSTNYFEGLIDEFLIFDRALTTAEIERLNDGASPSYFREYPNLFPGFYDVQSHAVDTLGAIGSTEVRTIGVETQGVFTSFIPPTYPDEFILPSPEAPINISSEDFVGGHYTFVDFDNDVLLWMRFDDVNGTGDPYDLSSYARNATLKNGTIINETGRFGDAAHFDGVDDEIVINGEFPVSREGSVSFWVRRNDATRSDRILGALDEYEARFSTNDPTKIANHFLAAGTNYVESNATFEEDIWYHVVMTWSAGTTTQEIYVNGTFDNDKTEANDIPSVTTVNMTLGDRTLQEDHLDGSLDEVIFFNRTLTPEEVASLYDAQASQYDHRFVPLTIGNHTFQGFSVDLLGTIGMTEQRRYEYFFSAPIVLDIVGIPDTIGLLPGQSTPITFSTIVRDTFASQITNPGSNVNATFVKSGETTRFDAVCEPANCHTSVCNFITDRNFSCTVDMQYYDAGTEWAAIVRATDTTGLTSLPYSEPFNIASLVSVQISGGVSWTGLIPGATSQLADGPFIVNNTGNTEIDFINISTTDLVEQTTPTQTISGSEFNVTTNSLLTCGEVALIANQNVSITAFTLPRGNNALNTLDANSGQEAFYFCLEQVPFGLAGGESYATETDSPWEIFLYADTGATIYLMVAVSGRGRRKKRRTLDLSGLDDSLYDLVDSKLDELMELIATRTPEGAKLTIPATIFAQGISPAEALVKYLHEQEKLTFSAIGRLLKRDQRSIWVTYHNAAKKHKRKLAVRDDTVNVEVTIFANRELSISEALVLHLKEEGMRNVAIAELIGKNQQNVWTLYSRAKKKLSRQY